VFFESRTIFERQQDSIPRPCLLDDENRKTNIGGIRSQSTSVVRQRLKLQYQTGLKVVAAGGILCIKRKIIRGRVGGCGGDFDRY
jgi:hypothetical protein